MGTCGQGENVHTFWLLLMRKQHECKVTAAMTTIAFDLRGLKVRTHRRLTQAWTVNSLDGVVWGWARAGAATPPRCLGQSTVMNAHTQRLPKLMLTQTQSQWHSPNCCQLRLSCTGACLKQLVSEI